MTDVSTELVQVQIDQLKNTMNTQELNQNIDQSIKLSKQVLLKQLTTSTSQKREEYNKLVTEGRALAHRDNVSYQTAENRFKKGFKQQINKDPTISTIRDVANLIAPDEESFKSNFDLVGWKQHFNVYVDNVRKAMEKGTHDLSEIEIPFDIRVIVLSRRHHHESICDTYDEGVEEYLANFSIQFDEVIKGVPTIAYELNENSEQATALNLEINAIDKKIRNIDSVMEELEAQLLADQLGQSDQGKKVLDMATNLINGHIEGDKKIKLLED